MPRTVTSATRQEAAEAFKLARRRGGARAGSIGRAAPAWQRARNGLALPRVIRTHRGIAPRRFAQVLERPQVRGQIR